MKVGQQFLEEVQAALREVCPAEELRVEGIEIYLGANPYSTQPTMVGQVRANTLAVSSSDLHQRLRARFPRCFTDEPPICSPAATASEIVAGFAGELAAGLLGRWLNLELHSGAQPLNDGLAACWIEFPLGAPVGPAFKTALVAVSEAVFANGEQTALADNHLSLLQKLCEKSRPNPQSQMLIAAARKRNIPYLCVGRSNSIWQFGWGNRSQIFLEAASNEDGLPAVNVAKNKLLAKHLFRELGLPTPRWRRLLPDQSPAAVAGKVAWPCVVKPIDSCNGEGITANISNIVELEQAVSLARRHSSRKLLIEAYEPGNDYRLMVVDGRLLAAVRREPPTISGDGRSTVRQLLAELNAARVGPPHEVGYLEIVVEDGALRERLRAHDLTMDTVLATGETLVLRSTANRSTGGICIDVTQQVHPQIRLWAEQLARAVGLRAAGVDYITRDIGRSHSEVGGGFIEINATPGLGVVAAAGLKEEDIGSVVLGEHPSRIPVTLILVADEGRDEVCRTVRAGMNGRDGLALASTDRAEAGGVPLAVNGQDPIAIATAALRYRSVDALTIIWPPTELYRFGLPVDRVEKTIIIGPPPDSEWLSLLRRISTELLFAEDGWPPVLAGGCSIDL